MNSERYIEEMRTIHEKILDFLEGEVENTNLKDIFKDNKFHDYLSLFHLILKIYNNHHRCVNLYNKIKEILQLFKEDIITKISNFQLFNIFKSNKHILLFFIEEGLLTFDEQIVKIIISDKYKYAGYPQYFQPEIQSFINKEWFPKYDKKWLINEWVLEIKKEIPDGFYEKRRIGENDNSICELIRKDLIDDFVVYVTKNSYELNSAINASIYETNNFIHKCARGKLALIEYAVFYGSIQIFNYLRLNGVELRPSLWLYAIHSKNADIIHILEENHIEPLNFSYKECLIESIKCHHNDIANYIQNQYLLNDNPNDMLPYILKYYNFYFVQYGLISESFYYLCKYDYCILASTLLREMNIDINMITIYDKYLIQFFY